MKKIRVADYIAQRVVDAGAKHVFLVTGGGAMHLNDAFNRHQNLSTVCFHHEQAAAMAAESYFRVTNKLVVLNVTTGPGGINALNGVFGAYVDSLGMLVVSGQVKRETYFRNYTTSLRQLGDQEVDIVSMAKPIVKYAHLLQDPLRVKEIMDKAIYLATSGRPGPVWIDVPVDVQGMLIDPDKLLGFDWNMKRFALDPDITDNTKLELSSFVNNSLDLDIKTILAKLERAKRPVIFAGAGIRLSGMHKEFLSLADKLKLPVVTGWNAHDALTNDNPYYCGRPGTVGDRAGNFTVQNADFLMVLGSRLNIRQVSYNWKSFAAKAWKVMVDIDQAELEKPTLQIDLKIRADLKVFIPKLIDALKNFSFQDSHQLYLEWCKTRVLQYPTVLNDYKNKKLKINPYIFINELFNTLTRDDVIITGNGSACVIGFQAANLKEGQRLYTNSGCASMGYDLPASIGASIGLENKRIICLAGDGSLMMNLQELQTLVGYKLPVKVIVLNNDGYLSISQTQQTYFSDNMFGIGPNNGVSFPDFVNLASAMNISSCRVNSIADWRSSKVQEMLANSSPVLIEVVVDPEQQFSPKLSSRKLDDGTMVSPTLEDMAPFLDRDEFFKNILVD